MMTNDPQSQTQLADESPPRRTQVSLVVLFLCVTYFSVASACALRWGLGMYVIAAGGFTTWLGYRGYLWWLQTQRSRPKTFAFAWMLFALSLALPAATSPGCGTTPKEPSRGWEMVHSGVVYGLTLADVTLQCTLNPLQITHEKFRETVLGLCHAAFVNLPNVMMLVSPVLLYRQQRLDRGHASPWWGCAAVSTWIWAILPDWDVRIGYYFWSTAILLMFLSRPVLPRTIQAMLVSGLVLLGLHFSQ
jgi:hypothetical protein